MALDPTDWSGETVVIVATGPSAKDAPLDRVRGLAKVIAINDSWKLAPWADVLYASDGLYWEPRKGVPEFQGLKVTASPRAAELFGLMQVSPVGRGKHSGSHAVYLAMDFGVKRIVLVGFDLGLLDANVAEFASVEIINSSPYSFLKNYPKADLLEAVSNVHSRPSRSNRPRHRIDAEREPVAESPGSDVSGVREGTDRGSEAGEPQSSWS